MPETAFNEPMVPFWEQTIEYGDYRAKVGEAIGECPYLKNLGTAALESIVETYAVLDSGDSSAEDEMMAEIDALLAEAAPESKQKPQQTEQTEATITEQLKSMDEIADQADDEASLITTGQTPGPIEDDLTHLDLPTPHTVNTVEVVPPLTPSVKQASKPQIRPIIATVTSETTDDLLTESKLDHFTVPHEEVTISNSASDVLPQPSSMDDLPVIAESMVSLAEDNPLEVQDLLITLPQPENFSPDVADELADALPSILESATFEPQDQLDTVELTVEPIVSENQEEVQALTTQLTEKIKVAYELEPEMGLTLFETISEIQRELVSLEIKSSDDIEEGFAAAVQKLRSLLELPESTNSQILLESVNQLIELLQTESIELLRLSNEQGTYEHALQQLMRSFKAKLPVNTLLGRLVLSLAA